MRARPKRTAGSSKGPLAGPTPRAPVASSRVSAHNASRDAVLATFRDASRVETRGERRSQRARGVDSGISWPSSTPSGREARVARVRRNAALETSRAVASDDMSAASSAAFDAGGTPGHRQRPLGRGRDGGCAAPHRLPGRMHLTSPSAFPRPPSDATRVATRARDFTRAPRRRPTPHSPADRARRAPSPRALASSPTPPDGFAEGPRDTANFLAD